MEFSGNKFKSSSVRSVSDAPVLSVERGDQSVDQLDVSDESCADFNHKELRVPRHVAIIMDGNGRWAKKRGLPRLAGHNAGMKAMIEATRAASDWGIRYLTVYAFSTENWKRSKEEVGGIFKLLIKYVESELRELNRNNVKVNVIGDYEKIPKAALLKLEETIETTRNNTGLNLNIALNYGSRAEIIRGIRSLVQKVLKEVDIPEAHEHSLKNNHDVYLKIQERLEEIITEDSFSRELYTGDELGNIPDPDLIIRTSGEERLSNFLLWQAAYSEFAFTPVMWPEFTREEFRHILKDYSGRDRRFGGR